MSRDKVQRQSFIEDYEELCNEVISKSLNNMSESFFEPIEDMESLRDDSNVQELEASFELIRERATPTTKFLDCSQESEMNMMMCPEEDLLEMSSARLADTKPIIVSTSDGSENHCSVDSGIDSTKATEGDETSVESAADEAKIVAKPPKVPKKHYSTSEVSMDNIVVIWNKKMMYFVSGSFICIHSQFCHPHFPVQPFLKECSQPFGSESEQDIA